MKYLKLFEEFVTGQDTGNVTDQDRGNDAQFDHSNSPVLREHVKKYVHDLLYSNQYKVIFDELGLEAPKDIEGQQMDGMFDEIEEKAIEYFRKHPERMTMNSDAPEVNQMSATGGNIGNDLTAHVPSITHT